MDNDDYIDGHQSFHWVDDGVLSERAHNAFMLYLKRLERQEHEHPLRGYHSYDHAKSLFAAIINEISWAYYRFIGLCQTDKDFLADIYLKPNKVISQGFAVDCGALFQTAGIDVKDVTRYFKKCLNQRRKQFYRINMDKRRSMFAQRENKFQFPYPFGLVKIGLEQVINVAVSSTVLRSEPGCYIQYPHCDSVSFFKEVMNGTVTDFLRDISFTGFMSLDEGSLVRATRVSGYPDEWDGNIAIIDDLEYERFSLLPCVLNVFPAHFVHSGDKLHLSFNEPHHFRLFYEMNAGHFSSKEQMFFRLRDSGPDDFEEEYEKYLVRKQRVVRLKNFKNEEEKFHSRV